MLSTAPPLPTLLVLALALVPSLMACASSPSGALPGAAELTSVEDFEPDRYLGLWYEISKYPFYFEKGLVGVTADYSRRDDGKLRVVNAGLVGDFFGKRKTAKAKAWAPDATRPERLKVQFFWPFSADYWVIALDPDYRWAVVGEPDRRYLWVLSRTPALPAETYTAILHEITELGYDVSRLELMPQTPPD